LFAEAVVFRLTAVAPDDACRFGERGDALHPIDQFSVPDVRRGIDFDDVVLFDYCGLIHRAVSVPKDENGVRSSTLPCERRIRRNPEDTWATFGGGLHAKRRSSVLRETGMT
jgi:hypothetical protein